MARKKKRWDDKLERWRRRKNEGGKLGREME